MNMKRLKKFIKRVLRVAILGSILLLGLSFYIFYIKNMGVVFFSNEFSEVDFTFITKKEGVKQISFTYPLTEQDYSEVSDEQFELQKEICYAIVEDDPLYERYCRKSFWDELEKRNSKKGIQKDEN